MNIEECIEYCSTFVNVDEARKELESMRATLAEVDVKTQRIESSLTRVSAQVKSMAVLVEIGREMRERFDHDLLCPDCGKRAGHAGVCAAARWDSALLAAKVDASVGTMRQGG